MANRYTPKGLKRRFKATPDQPQLIVKATGAPYLGIDYFFDPNKNKYFTGKPTDPAIIQDELVEGFSSVELGDNEKGYVEPLLYDTLKGDSVGYNVRVTSPIPTIDGTPSEKDRAIGVYDRYFMQHKTSGEVSEITQENYLKLQSKDSSYHYPSYIIGQTLWRLRGPVANQDINGYIIQGAREVNEILINQLQQQVPNIRTYLTDPTQFVE